MMFITTETWGSAVDKLVSIRVQEFKKKIGNFAGEGLRSSLFAI